MPFSDLRLSQKLALNDVLAAVKDLGAAPCACLDRCFEWPPLLIVNQRLAWAMVCLFVSSHCPVPSSGTAGVDLIGGS